MSVLVQALSIANDRKPTRPADFMDWEIYGLGN